MNCLNKMNTFIRAITKILTIEDEHTYFDFLPDEIIAEILIYLELQDINNLRFIRKIENLISNKHFWQKVLFRGNMSFYVDFLGYSDQKYLKEVLQFYEAENYVNQIVDSLLLKEINICLFISNKIKFFDMIEIYSISDISKINIEIINIDIINNRYDYYYGSIGSLNKTYIISVLNDSVAILCKQTIPPSGPLDFLRYIELNQIKKLLVKIFLARK